MSATRTLLEEQISQALLDAPCVSPEGEELGLLTSIGEVEMRGLITAVADWLEGLSSVDAVKAEVARAAVDGRELLPYWSGRTLRGLALLLRR